ncbi:hypothetical protein ACVDG5_008640 [Mesorhizobium sp. ORM6]
MPNFTAILCETEGLALIKPVAAFTDAAAARLCLRCTQAQGTSAVHPQAGEGLAACIYDHKTLRHTGRIHGRNHFQAARGHAGQKADRSESLDYRLAGGGYSASRKPRQKPKAGGLIIHVGRSAAPVAEAKPSIQVTINGRVISKDQNTGRQLHHIGAVSSTGEKKPFCFVASTKIWSPPRFADVFVSPMGERAALRLVCMAIEAVCPAGVPPAEEWVIGL